jgi:hypothetical protein
MPGLGRKVFTAGDVLTASDVQNYFMDQAVMNFAGTAARSSAIATPTTGMTTYIGMTGTATIPQIEIYTGATWQTPYALTQVANVSFTAAATIQIDNVFTSAYQNYIVIMAFTASTTTPTYLRYRSGGATLTDTIYSVSAGNQSTSLTFAGSARSDSYALFWPAYATYPNYINVQFANPQATGYTSHRSDAVWATATETGHGLASGSNKVTTSITGFELTTASTPTLTGTFRVYGLRNS